MKNPESESAGTSSVRDPNELLPEYDPDLIRHGIRAKYVQRFREGTNIVVLEPDNAKVFPDSASVNAALRALLEIKRRAGE